MDAKLQVISGNASKDLIPLNLPTTIGRGKEASLTIAHPLISRQHCRLYEAKGLLMIQDAGSTNGTFVGGRKIREAPLPPETEFSIGPLTFRVKYQYSGDLKSLPAPKYAEQSDLPASEETPEFEVVDDEDMDFLLAGDSIIGADSPAKPTGKTVDKPAAKGVEKSRKLSDTKSSAEDLLETTPLPTMKKETPAKAKEAPAKNDKTPGPQAKKPSPAPSAVESPANDISDDEFDKFFEEL
jgi:pSer/pThr/pTyr-binding forkhead associated (FHA) protein